MQTKEKIELVIFDWAGTTVDYGSGAPSAVFGKVFHEAGVDLTKEEIDRPMGMEKRAHIRQLLSTESGSKQWEEKYGRPWNEEDVTDLYEKFEATLHEMVTDRSDPLDGVVETVARLREAGLKIGSTTGYNDWMMEQVRPRAAAGGYEPDCVVTPDTTGIGRPSPFMLYECMRQLNVYPASHVVKVGDTTVDMEEGVNAGAFCVGILTGSSLLGLTEEQYASLSEEELEARKEAAADKYFEAGADLVIDSIRDLPEAIETLNQYLAEDAACECECCECREEKEEE